MVSEMEEIIVLVKNLNATSMVWNYFGLEANKQGTPKPSKDQAPMCQSFKKEGNRRNLHYNGAHQQTPCWAVCWSTFSTKSRDRVTKGKNAFDSNDASTSTSKQSVHHPSENTKEASLAS